MIQYIANETLSFDEYVDFLRRSDLGSQYPQPQFQQKVSKLLTSCSVSIAARNQQGLLVGVALDISDFAYYLFVTDLGVARDYTGQGIGRELLSRLQQTASQDFAVSTVAVSHISARGFYQQCDFSSADFLFWKPTIELLSMQGEHENWLDQKNID